MSQKGRYTATGRGRSSRSRRWFGMALQPATAQVLLILGIIGILGTSIWMIFILLGIMSYLSMLSYYQSVTEAYGVGTYYAAYGASAMTYYIVYMVVAIALLILCIYTVNCCRRR